MIERERKREIEGEGSKRSLYVELMLECNTIRSCRPLYIYLVMDRVSSLHLHVYFFLCVCALVATWVTKCLCNCACVCVCGGGG